MVGGGIYDAENSKKPMAKLFPKNVEITPYNAVRVRPEKNEVETEDGRIWTYDQLIIATGNVLNWNAIKGSLDALNDPECPAGSIYTVNSAQKFNKLVSDFNGGTAIFTHPIVPIKCAGAPLKITFLSEERFREKGIRGKTNVQFRSAVGVYFGVPKFAAQLAELLK